LGKKYATLYKYSNSNWFFVNTIFQNYFSFIHF
jgi:hypothetical protein